MSSAKGAKGSDEEDDRKPSPIEGGSGEAHGEQQDESSPGRRESLPDDESENVSGVARRQPEEEQRRKRRRSASSSRRELPRASSRQARMPSQQLFRSRGKGKTRLPEKLMEHLNGRVAPNALWWMPNGKAFAMDSDRFQQEVLDVYFRGTKAQSFIRSLNRWGFRRLFVSSLPKTAVCFHQKLFRRNEPHLVRQMELQSYTPQSSQVDTESDDSVASTSVPAPQPPTRAELGNETSFPRKSTSQRRTPQPVQVQQVQSASHLLSEMRDLAPQPQSASQPEVPTVTAQAQAQPNTLGAQQVLSFALPQPQNTAGSLPEFSGQQADSIRTLQQLVAQATQSSSSGPAALGALGTQQPVAPVQQASNETQQQEDLVALLQRRLTQQRQMDEASLAGPLGMQPQVNQYMPPSEPSQTVLNQIMPGGSQPDLGAATLAAILSTVLQGPEVPAAQQEINPSRAQADLQAILQHLQPNAGAEMQAIPQAATTQTQEAQPAGPQHDLQAFLQQLMPQVPQPNLGGNSASLLGSQTPNPAAATQPQEQQQSGPPIDAQTLFLQLLSQVGQGNEPSATRPPPPVQGSRTDDTTAAPSLLSDLISSLQPPSQRQGYQEQPQMQSPFAGLQQQLQPQFPTSTVLPNPPIQQARQPEPANQQGSLLNMALELSRALAQQPSLQSLPSTLAQSSPVHPPQQAPPNPEAPQRSSQGGSSQRMFPFPFDPSQRQNFGGGNLGKQDP